MRSNSSLNQTSGKNDAAGASSASHSVHLSGISVSAGIVIAKLHIGASGPAQVPEVELKPDEVEAEVERFHASLNLSYAQLEALKKRVAEILGERDAAIFDAHMMLVADEVIHKDVVDGIREMQRNAEYVYKKVVDRYAKALQHVEDNYIRDRLTDIRDVCDRVIRNLQGQQVGSIGDLQGPRILAGYDFAPSDTAAMDREHVVGFVTAVGSRTSHTAIMARSMGIPAVVGVVDLLDHVKNGDQVVIDGYHGRIIVRPTEDELDVYEKHLALQERWFRNIEAEAALPPETLDGFRVQLSANIELPGEVADVKKTAGVGIGLFRTEYLFLNAQELPDEECQFEAYRRVVSEMLPQSVILRTIDIGGDKFLQEFDYLHEANPNLGMRAIRFCLRKTDIFRAQLRAMLRASAHGKVRIMFPMVSTLDELLEALQHLNEVKAELDREGTAYNPYLDVGMMIEVPAAALTAQKLAEHVDFFSIGTNDLVQYALAADRGNPSVSYLYQPCHPAMIRLIRDVVHAAYDHGKWVSICGEMAGEPLMLPLVLGLNIHELSMSPVAIGPIKRLIRRMRMHEAEELVRKAQECGTASEVHGLCEAYVRRIAPDLIPD